MLYNKFYLNENNKLIYVLNEQHGLVNGTELVNIVGMKLQLFNDDSIIKKMKLYETFPDEDGKNIHVLGSYFVDQNDDVFAVNSINTDVKIASFSYKTQGIEISEAQIRYSDHIQLLLMIHNQYINTSEKIKTLVKYHCNTKDDALMLLQNLSTEYVLEAMSYIEYIDVLDYVQSRLLYISHESHTIEHVIKYCKIINDKLTNASVYGRSVVFETFSDVDSIDFSHYTQLDHIHKELIIEYFKYDAKKLLDLFSINDTDMTHTSIIRNLKRLYDIDYTVFDEIELMELDEIEELLIAILTDNIAGVLRIIKDNSVFYTTDMSAVPLICMMSEGMKFDLIRADEEDGWLLSNNSISMMNITSKMNKE